jgi:hypothetical protein
MSFDTILVALGVVLGVAYFARRNARKHHHNQSQRDHAPVWHGRRV